MPLPVRPSTLQTALVTPLNPPRKFNTKLVASAMSLALIAAGLFAAPHLVTFQSAEQHEAAGPKAIEPAKPREPIAISTTAPKDGASVRFKPGSLKPTPPPGQPIGYAGVNPTSSVRLPPNDAQIQNSNDIPRSPQGQSPYADRPFDNSYPPPPPPPGGPMFGPPNGPGAGPPPNRRPRP
jgi:hypothetical protein